MSINEQKPHICFFIGSLSNSGGTERITTTLANALIQEGYQISIINIFLDKKVFFKIDERIKLYSIFNKSRNYTFYLPYIVYSLWKKTIELKVDILINVDVILALFSLPVKFFSFNFKIISWEHFSCKTNLGVKRRDYARILSKKYADSIVTLTKQDKDFYLKDKDSKAEIVCISNFLENIPTFTSRLDNKNVIAVGRFCYEKGFDILIDVWALVKMNDVSKDWILKIIGDGVEKENIRKKIEILNLNDSVKIENATKYIEDYYLSSSLLVMSSRNEGWGLVLQEAKSYGLPTISFDLSGPSDLIKDNNNGFLVPFGDIQLMSKRICELMSDDKKRKQFGIAAREDLVNFSKEKIILKWETLFNNILNNSYWLF